jgi:hypothetical protein
MGINETDKDVILNALNDLKKGSMAMMISQILSLILTVILIATLLPLIYMYLTAATAPSAQTMPFRGLIAVAIITTGIFGLASLIFTIYGIYLKFIPGSSKLKKWKDEFSAPSTLMKIGYIGGLILIVIGIAVMVILAITLLPAIGRGAFSTPMNLLRFLSPLFGGLAITMIGGLLWLIGVIGMIILFFKLSSIFSETLLLVVAIVFIMAIISGLLAAIPFIGIFISIATTLLPLIAWILAYIGIGNIIKRLSAK